MKNFSPLKKALIISTMVAPLVLASCGKDDKATEEKTAAMTTSSSVTTSSSPTTTSSSEETSTEATSSEETSTEETTTVTETTTDDVVKDPATTEATTSAKPTTTASTSAKASSSAVTSTVALPKSAHQQPVNGKAASPEDTKALKQLSESVIWAPNQRDFVVNVIQHTCNKLLNEQGGKNNLLAAANLFPPTPMDPAQRPELVKFEDVKVSGNEASAQVTVRSQGQVVSDVQRYEKEGNTWTLCGDSAALKASANQ